MSFNQKHCCQNSERNLIFQKADVHQLILYCESSDCMRMIKSLSSPIWISLNTPWFGPLSECHRTFIFIPFFLSIPYREMASTDVLSAHSATSPPPLCLALCLHGFLHCAYMYTYRAFHLENISYHSTYRSSGVKHFLLLFPPPCLLFLS